VTSTNRWRRITIDGVEVTQFVADSRDPSASRRSSDGCASENERAEPSREARKLMNSISSSSESATAGPGISVPSTSSSHTRSWPRMMMFSTRSSSTSGWSRPNRNNESKIACASAACSARVQVD